jgi:hypothetical protein
MKPEIEFLPEQQTGFVFTVLVEELWPVSVGLRADQTIT